MNRKGLLFVISAPSGVGKTTICSEVLKSVSHIKFSISATTRAPREGETDGKDYLFLSKDDFLKRVDNNEFAEWAQVYGNYYGTPVKPVLNSLQNGVDILLDIDVQGGMRIKRYWPQSVLVFVRPPSIEVLTKRLRDRGLDSEEDIEKRLQEFEKEMEYCDRYDYVIINDVLQKAVGHLKKIIENERNKDK